LTESAASLRPEPPIASWTGETRPTTEAMAAALCAELPPGVTMVPAGAAAVTVPVATTPAPSPRDHIRVLVDALGDAYRRESMGAMPRGVRLAIEQLVAARAEEGR
jgi:hypothetical protein